MKKTVLPTSITFKNKAGKQFTLKKKPVEIKEYKSNPTRPKNRKHTA